MIPVNTPEEFQRWLSKGPQRSPEAYKRLTGGFSKGAGEIEGKAIPVRLEGYQEAFTKPFPPPIKESKDFTEAIDDQWDAREP